MSITTSISEINRNTYMLIGSGAMMMMGAKNIVYSNHANSITWQIMRNASGWTHIKLTYVPGPDLYTLEFFKIRNIDIKASKKFEGLYCDQIREIIEKETGLYLYI